MVLKFKCEKCGNCCTNFGRIPKKEYPILEENGVIMLSTPSLILYDWEAQLFPKGSTTPCEVFYDKTKNITIIMSYTLKNKKCPHQMKNSKCEIYNNRPIACRAFPCAYSDVKFVKDSKVLVDNSNICKAELTKEELYSLLGENKENVITFDNQKMIKNSYKRYGDVFVYSFMKSTNDRLVGRVLVELQVKHGFRFPTGEENPQELFEKIKNSKKLGFSQVFKKYTGNNLKDNFSKQNFKTVKDILRKQARS